MGIQYDPPARGRPGLERRAASWRQAGAEGPADLGHPAFPVSGGSHARRALFDLAIDSKLRGCDLIRLKIGTLVSGHDLRARAMVIQQKTGRPVQFQITTAARTSLLAWLER
ncbi:hypothetical protein [Devosia albogilva]|uniref:hypothetical protein n=1 Tax=Devosia albogilva TaxID=429726 RepID=UPI0036DE13B2